MQLEDEEVELNADDMYVVPKGVMHNPVADKECWVMLIETVTTKHTVDVNTANDEVDCQAASFVMFFLRCVEKQAQSFVVHWSCRKSPDPACTP